MLDHSARTQAVDWPRSLDHCEQVDLDKGHGLEGTGEGLLGSGDIKPW